MSIIDLESIQLIGGDRPPQNFMMLHTQQGQINWLAQALCKINESIRIDGVTVGVGIEQYTFVTTSDDPVGGLGFIGEEYTIPFLLSVNGLILNEGADYTVTRSDTGMQFAFTTPLEHSGIIVTLYFLSVQPIARN